MNIAIIGSSPTTVLMAYKLSKRNNVTIFERSKNYGGAWSWEKHFGANVSSKTNIFEPTNIKEEISLKKVTKFFNSEFKIKPKIINASYNLHGGYSPKKLYEFDLIKIYKKILSNSKIKIVKKKISSVDLSKKVKINKKYIFDKLYVPFFVGIKEFCIYGKKIKTDYKLITSKHLFMVSKSRFFKKFYYSINFNSFLDRAQQQKKNNFFFLKQE